MLSRCKKRSSLNRQDVSQRAPIMQLPAGGAVHRCGPARAIVAMCRCSQDTLVFSPVSSTRVHGALRLGFYIPTECKPPGPAIAEDQAHGLRGHVTKVRRIIHEAAPVRSAQPAPASMRSAATCRPLGQSEADRPPRAPAQRRAGSVVGLCQINRAARFL